MTTIRSKVLSGTLAVVLLLAGTLAIAPSPASAQFRTIKRPSPALLISGVAGALIVALAVGLSGGGNDQPEPPVSP